MGAGGRGLVITWIPQGSRRWWASSCSPRQTAAVLEDLTARTPGLVHAEINLAEQPDTARELGVMRTPTVVAFDRSGSELLRVSGVPRAAELASALAPSLAA